MKNALGLNNNQQEPSKPIEDPFGNFYEAAKHRNENVILRTKKGDRSIEVEMPSRGEEQLADLVVPMSPQFADTGSGRGPASTGDGYGLDAKYQEQRPGLTDREIAQSMPQGSPEMAGKRSEIEEGLGLVGADDSAPENDKSYLAAIDYIKQLYKSRRYEAALIEIDRMLPRYPTDAKLYEMRGTLLAKLGYEDLAMKSWEQALSLNPRNKSLAKFLQARKDPLRRGTASSP